MSDTQATFWQAMHEANARGRLGLIVYLVPGFPSVAQHDDTLSLLEATPEVSIIETTIPVTGDFSHYANETIRAAHTTGAAAGGKPRKLTKPSLCVLYQQSVIEAGGPGALLDAHAGLFDGLICEWSNPDEATYVEVGNQRGLEVVQAMGPSTTEEGAQRTLALVRDKGLIYLVSAKMTGAELYSNDALARAIERIRRDRPNAKVAAGFGVSTPEHVRRLAEVDGLDGVIIGTRFIKEMARGFDATKEYLASIVDALAKKGGR